MRRKKTISIIVICIILIIGISTVILYKLGDRIFDEIISNQIVDIEKAINENPSDTSVTPVNSNTNMPSTTSAEVGSHQSSTSPVNQTNEQTPQAAVSQAEPSSDTQITKDEIQQIKNSISPSDKISAATLVLAKLSQADIKKITEMTVGGITEQEKSIMKNIVYSRFNAEEIERIKEMYIKYMK